MKRKHEGDDSPVNEAHRGDVEILEQEGVGKQEAACGKS